MRPIGCATFIQSQPEMAERMGKGQASIGSSKSQLRSWTKGKE